MWNVYVHSAIFRIEVFMKGRSKYSEYIKEQERNKAASQQAARLREIENVREQLFKDIESYRKLLNDQVLLGNKSELEKRNVDGLLKSISGLSVELNEKNIGEGGLTLAVSALNAILILHGQINELRWRLYETHKKVQALTEEKAEDKVEPTEESENKEEQVEPTE